LYRVYVARFWHLGGCRGGLYERKYGLTVCQTHHWAKLSPSVTLVVPLLRMNEKHCTAAKRKEGLKRK